MSGASLRDAALDAQLAELLLPCQDDPLRFVLTCIPGSDPDDWQTDGLERIGESLQTTGKLRFAVKAGTGVGKGAFASWLVLWHTLTRPNSAGLITANTRAQLQTKTWRELTLWKDRLVPPLAALLDVSASRLSHLAAPRTWGIDALAWSAERSQAFAGLHAPSQLVVFDEASTIDDIIWDTVLGSQTTRDTMWVVLGNPTRSSGRFRDCWGRYRHRWTTMTVDSRLARMTDKAEIAEWIQDYGIDSDYVRMRVLGQFPMQASQQLIATDLVEAARRRRIDDRASVHEPLLVGVDVARFGDDRSVIAFRQGRDARSFPWEHFQGADTMQLADRVVAIAAGAATAGRRPDGIFVDGVGVGGGTVDRCRQLGVDVIEVNAGAKSHDPRYANARARMWCGVRDWLPGAAIPDDEALQGDLTGVEFSYTDKQAIILERKEMMKRRGLPSPDDGDALANTFFAPVLRAFGTGYGDPHAGRILSDWDPHGD